MSLLAKMQALKAAHEFKHGGEDAGAESTQGSGLKMVKTECVSPAPARSDARFGVEDGKSESDLFKDPGERKRLWQRFTSTFTPASGRVSRVSKCPESLSAMITTPAERTSWFLEWVKGNCDWANVQIEEIVGRQDREVDSTSMEWMTLDQAIFVYKSETVGTALCEKAGESARTCRRHPDIPWCDDARQYLVPSL